MNNNIDIVVTYLDPKNKKWQDLYNKYVDKEVTEGKHKSDDLAAFSEARWRDWGLFKYWVRATITNCPWLHKLFIIVQDKDQIPDWLDISSKKLRVVEHSEFIPRDLLPTFSGVNIDLWLSKISDLSDNFILCDDDYYILNPIPNNFFFENNIPVRQNMFEPLNIISDEDKNATNWQRILSNTNKLVAQYTNNFIKQYSFLHLPEAHNKTFELDFLNKHYNIIYNSMAYSHFRYDKNLSCALYTNLMASWGISIEKPIYDNSRYRGIKDLIMPDLFLESGFDMACINDTDDSVFNTVTVNKLQQAFQKRFPNKCILEK